MSHFFTDEESLEEALQRRAEELITLIKCSRATQKKRRNVFVAMKKIIHEAFGDDLQVHMFGSVPLNTFLPDGDIDIVLFGSRSLESKWASIIRDALAARVSTAHEGELRNVDEESPEAFPVRQISVIDADVKIVKAVVGGIAVDISMRQPGGPVSVSFLESMDRAIGKDELLKRSVLLVKGWAHYVARVMGSHHGLLSTYALQTMIIYVIFLHYDQVKTPLDVLLRFLGFFSSFDYSRHCITLYGPIAVQAISVHHPEASLHYQNPANPNVETAFEGTGTLDPSVELHHIPRPKFLRDRPEIVKEIHAFEALKRKYTRLVSPPAPDRDMVHAPFPARTLNIMDPLDPHNNLGRSVSRSNLYRLRSAFTSGYRGLAVVLQSRGPEHIALGKIDYFFLPLWRRYGGKMSSIHVTREKEKEAEAEMVKASPGLEGNKAEMEEALASILRVLETDPSPPPQPATIRGHADGGASRRASSRRDSAETRKSHKVTATQTSVPAPPAGGGAQLPLQRRTNHSATRAHRRTHRARQGSDKGVGGGGGGGGGRNLPTRLPFGEAEFPPLLPS